jgi:hypothetical protein
MRLVVPGDMTRWGHTFHIWNTPAPPNLELSRRHQVAEAKRRTVHAIELSEVTRLTFFYTRSRVRRIRVHRSNQSSHLIDDCGRALVDEERLSPVWIHLPISKQDPIIYLGIGVPDTPFIRGNIEGLLVKTKLGFISGRRANLLARMLSPSRSWVLCHR